MVDRIAIFGAGEQGRVVASVYQDEGVEIACFLDNDAAKQGSCVLGIPVTSVEEYLSGNHLYPVIIAGDPKLHERMILQLKEGGFQNYQIFNKSMILSKERILSYAYDTENEDVILYHVLRDETDIFWIDVGCNDPAIGSVTKLFYDKGFCGINIDMDSVMIEITNRERTRDINLCVGVGSSNERRTYYAQGDFGGLNTFVESNALDHRAEKKEANICTLKYICEEYVKNKAVSFLKIDVEGFEKEVLLGADFDTYRPKILVIESTLPNTDTPNYEQWESIVLGSNYHLAYMHGVNRYYVADEWAELDKSFIPWNEMAAKYCILQVGLAYYS